MLVVHPALIAEDGVELLPCPHTALTDRKPGKLLFRLYFCDLVTADFISSFDYS